MYVGVTNDLERRLAEHKSEKIEGFTRKYNVNKLVHFEEFGAIELTIIREKEIKGWRREKKNDLVEKHNPQWKDISDEWYPDPSALRSG